MRRDGRLNAGKPLSRLPTVLDFARFLTKTEVSEDPPPINSQTGRPHRTPCLLFLSSREEKGYGQFWFAGRCHKAQRFSFQAFHQRLLREGTHVAHTCNNAPCVNPEHLIESSEAENVAECNRRLPRRRVPKEVLDEIPF